MKINETLHIRRLKKEDMKSFFDFRLQALKNAPTSFSSSYEEEKVSGMAFFKNLLSQDSVDNLVFGAFIDDELIGTVGIFQEKHSKTKHKCNLLGMYVHPDSRNQGVGKALVKKTIAHAKNEMKCSILILSVETTNLVAKKLYESCGFKVWGTEPKALQIEGKFYEEFHMSLLLTAKK